MIPRGVQRILRELCMLQEPVQQKEIAHATHCSPSLVAKIMKILVKKKYIHHPTRTTVAVANQQYLILYWAFKRDLEDEILTSKETSLTPSDLENEVIKAVPRSAFTAFTAAKIIGVQESP